jgi:hypothetical protein
MEDQVFVVSYDVGNPFKSLILPGASIRSGGSMIFAALPAPESILRSIEGVKIGKTLLESAKDFRPPHPKAKYYAAVQAGKKKK